MDDGQEPRTRASGLIVYAPGLDERSPRFHICRSAREGGIEPLLTRLKAEPALEGYEYFVYDRGVVGKFSRGRLADRGHELAVAINSRWLALGKPKEVILMGHSIGGLLIREAYLDASDDVGSDRHEWVDRVKRIVLFACPNRGFDPRRLGAFKRSALAVALALPVLTGGFTGLDAVVGSPFITDLRIRWMRQIRPLETPPMVVQVLGTRDGLVVSSDSLDIETMPNSAEVEIPYANHANVIQPNPVWTEEVEGEQYRLIKSAIFETPSPIPGETRPPEADSKITDVVLLLHGIRADAFGWARELSKTMNSDSFRIETPSYGYLAAFGFALPFGHNRQRRKFADWYTHLYCTYHKADFHFVGHSNGTYIFGRTLDAVPAMRFERVYLAGCVLPREWSPRPSQVETLVNACGRSDIPVGILCSALSGLGRRSIGVAGFTGFDTPPPGTQFVTLRGGHDAGLQAARLPGVASFIADEVLPRDDDAGKNKKRWIVRRPNPLFGFASRSARILALPLSAALIATLVLVCLTSMTAVWIVLGALAAIGYFLTAF